MAETLTQAEIDSLKPYPLPALKLTPLTGQESFTFQNKPLAQVNHFWRWGISDLVSNTNRGIVAEYIVALALGLDLSGVRDEWRAYDLNLPPGFHIEVKSAGYVQSWGQRELSTIKFNIAERKAWDRETNILGNISARRSDLYIFALHAHKDKATINPMNLEQWLFYVVWTKTLNTKAWRQKSISLKALEKICPVGVAFDQLTETVKKSIYG